MKLDYTEFSYGYAFTENLIRASAYGPSSAPVFPNLIQEAELGYDVKIDLPAVPIFFQFKLPQLMVRDTAKEISSYHLPLSTPFFRMSLMRRDFSNQHQKLVDLERHFPGTVFYASPLSENIAHFNASYSAASVHLESALFSPIDIGPLPDNENHSIAYSRTSPFAWFCSEPEKIKKITFEALVDSVNNMLPNRASQTLADSAFLAHRKLNELLPPQLRNAEGEIRQRIASRWDRLEIHRDIDDEVRTSLVELLVMRELARVGLGVDMAIAQPRQRETGEEQ